jgi:carboxyl-terminal processing protease
MATRRRTPVHVATLVAAGLAVLVIGVWLGGHPSWIPSGLRGTFNDEGKTGQFVQNVLSEVQRDFYRKVEVTQLAEVGLGAAIASLHDPYSHYYSRSQYASFADETNPRDRGIGVFVKAVAQGLEITGVFPDSPAARAGLQNGDVIVAVGRVALAGRTPTFAADRIQGRPGTPVTLTVASGPRRRVLTLTRASVAEPVASSQLIAYHGVRIGDVAFASFRQGSGAELQAQVKKALHQGAQALILDLRDNGGGLLQEAINVASIFIPTGTIVSTKGRTQPRQVYVAHGDAISTKVPLVVLVNGDTASSAEIVTAALQDRGRAKVVGTHTYGKGVYQEIQNLSNGGALEITVGEFFTPSGRNLGGGGDKRGAGVSPNVYASASDPAQQLAVAEQTVAAEVAGAPRP